VISISGIVLSESAVWENETSYSMPFSSEETLTNGDRLIYSDGSDTRIDIYQPKIAGEMTRETVSALLELARTKAPLSVNLNGKLINAVFRYEDGAVDVEPLNARQVQAENDSYFGTIRLLEV